MSNLPGLFGYLYRAMVTLGEEGEGWVVVTLVGRSKNPSSEHVALTPQAQISCFTIRNPHRLECSSHLDCHSMAFRHEDGILHDRLVAITKVLLRRNLGRRRRMSGMEIMGRL